VLFQAGNGWSSGARPRAGEIASPAPSLGTNSDRVGSPRSAHPTDRFPAPDGGARIRGRDDSYSFPQVGYVTAVRAHEATILRVRPARGDVVSTTSPTSGARTSATRADRERCRSHGATATSSRDVSRYDAVEALMTRGRRLPGLDILYTRHPGRPLRPQMTPATAAVIQTNLDAFLLSKLAARSSATADVSSTSLLAGIVGFHGQAKQRRPGGGHRADQGMSRRSPGGTSRSNAVAPANPHTDSRRLKPRFGRVQKQIPSDGWPAGRSGHAVLFLASRSPTSPGRRCRSTGVGSEMSKLISSRSARRS